MGRRAHGKFWATKYREGPIHLQSVAVRGTWTELFSLVIDSTFADHGVIQLSTTMGYTDAQLAELCNIDVRTWEAHKKALQDIGEIKVLQGNRIQWLHWNTTQPEYDRQKKYRGKRLHQKVTHETTQKGYTEKLQGEERREKREKKEEKRKDKDKQRDTTSLVKPKDTSKTLLIRDILGVTGDREWAAYYRHVVYNLQGPVVYRILSAVKQARRGGEIRTKPGALFKHLADKELTIVGKPWNKEAS